MAWFERWRRQRILRQGPLDEPRWRRAVERYPFVRVLPQHDLARLRDLVVLFLHQKSISGAGGLEIDEDICLAIAVQACILILNLDLSCYDGWEEVIVYPDQFVAEYEAVDEAGVAHVVREAISGEAWERGPVILSWADMDAAGQGRRYNVVIHEFAHKLDMLNGDANGFPPLHAGMSREGWVRDFSSAYEDFCARIDRDEPTVVDSYAAENPGEFFAVLSEALFEVPLELNAAYPAVYRQLCAYYRQDPLELRHVPAGSGQPAKPHTHGFS